MPVTIYWPTYVISIPQNYLTLVSGTLYELDTEQFREDLKALEDNEQGITYPKTHEHYTEYTVAGVTYARAIIIISPYTITFEDGQYSVRLAGSNNNIFDVENGVLNQNQVQIIPGNSAGLIVKSIGSGLSTEEHDAVINTDTTVTSMDGKVDTIGTDVISIENKVDAVDLVVDDTNTKIDLCVADFILIKKFVTNKKILIKETDVWYLVIYDDNETTEILRKALKDSNSLEITDLTAGALAMEMASSV